jgi:hypothetical protein
MLLCAEEEREYTPIEVKNEIFFVIFTEIPAFQKSK